MREALTSVEDFSDIKTDLGAKQCKIKAKKDYDIKAKLNELAKATSEIEGFSFN